VDGNNDLKRSPANPVVGLPISQYDDSRIVGAGAELRYRLSRVWSVAIGGWLENFQLRDAQTTGVTNYMPAEFALAALDADYKGRVGYLRATYSW
jgi:hypothetical protein